MEHIIFSANIVLPLLVLVSFGYLAKIFNFIDKETTKKCNDFAFQLFLPVLMFNNIRTSNIENLAETNIFLFALIVTPTVFLITSLLVPLIEPSNPRRGVMIQGIARSNYSLFGIPLVSMLFPDQDISVASLLIAIVIPIFNIASVIILTYFGSKTLELKSVLLNILKNPLIIGCFFGMIFMVFQIPVPHFLNVALLDIGGIATPFALFILGAGFEFQKIKPIIKQVGISVLGRLVIVPLITVSIGILCGFRGVELACILVIYSSPTAVGSYPMAQKMGGDAELASAIVVFTTIGSIFASFSSILILSQFGFL